ncbi:MAG: hypothetical protein ACFFC3_02810 [Candidatus Odinarchaeota archaeon]
MIIKYKNIYVILAVILILGIVINIKVGTTQTNPISATSDHYRDPKSDVVIYDNETKTSRATSLHPELDIDSMTRSGQVIVVTVYEHFDFSLGHTYFLKIEDGKDEYISTYSYDLDIVSLTKTGEGVWNGTEWTNGEPTNIGFLSGKTLTINIPSTALAMKSTMYWSFWYQYTDPETGVVYLDVAPEYELVELCPDYDPGQGIPGYELSIIILITSLFTIGLVILKTKVLKYK